MPEERGGGGNICRTQILNLSRLRFGPKNICWTLLLNLIRLRFRPYILLAEPHA